MLDEALRERIRRLRLALAEEALANADGRPGREAGAEPEPGGQPRPPFPGAVRLEDIRDAREATSDWGKFFLIEREVGHLVGHAEVLEAYRTLIDRTVGSGKCQPPFAFLDLETTGLSSTPLFLAGLLVVGEAGPKAVQLLARDYSEERAVIGAIDKALRDSEACITFNGKAFDIPYLKERAKYHRLALAAEPRQFDLLHHARRLWRRNLPNCRLLTLEWFILGRRRTGDVCGWEVPCIYHEFVHTGDAARLMHVLRHNFMDVLSMAELFVCLAEAHAC